jgi:hypothetical protein
MSGDIQTAKCYPGTTFRVYDLHQKRIQYYNGNGVYKLLTMMAGWGLNVPSGKRKLTSTMSL